MLADLLLIAVRAAHLLAAAAWVGGALAYAVGGPPASSTGRRAFSRLVGICIWVLIVSGAVLTVDRLANARASSLYVALLALKILLAIGMFLVARLLAPPASGRRPSPAGAPTSSPASPAGWRLWLTPPYLLLVMGVAVYAIGASLAIVYVRTIATPPG